MADFPDDATGEVLRNMHEEGVDFTVPHVVEFVLLFSEKEAADRCAVAVGNLGQFDVSVLENDIAEGFDVLAKRTMLLDYDAINETEDALTGIADTFGGQFDGWGVLVD
jgi:regulator of RNase E activity RraB